MASQLAVVSARARRLHRILSRAADLTPAGQTVKILEEAGEAAQAADAHDFGELMHELADVIVAATQAALSVDPDGLDLLWDELADTLDEDCRRDWHSYGGVIRHSAPWTRAEVEETAEAATVTISPDPGRTGTAHVTVRAPIPAGLPPRLRGMRPDVMSDFAADLLSHTRLAPPPGRRLTIADTTVGDGTLTVCGTLTACEGAARAKEASW